MIFKKKTLNVRIICCNAILLQDMAELNIYYPSVTIKAYDSRGFGCFKYVGVCIVPTVHMFIEQLITEEDYDAQIYGTRFKSPWTRKQSTIRKYS